MPLYGLGTLPPSMTDTLLSVGQQLPATMTTSRPPVENTAISTVMAPSTNNDTQGGSQATVDKPQVYQRVP